jgi:hypothetical protein
MEKLGHDEYDDDDDDEMKTMMMEMMKRMMSLSLKNLPYHQGMRLV